MNVETVRINLRYEQADLESLFRYAHAHDVVQAGRYDLRRSPRLNIWTHTWANPGCRAESSLMFTLEFDLEHRIVDVSNVAARLRLEGISRRAGEIGEGGIGRYGLRKTSGRADSVTVALCHRVGPSYSRA